MSVQPALSHGRCAMVHWRPRRTKARTMCVHKVALAVKFNEPVVLYVVRARMALNVAHSCWCSRTWWRLTGGWRQGATGLPSLELPAWLLRLLATSWAHSGLVELESSLSPTSRGSTTKQSSPPRLARPSRRQASRSAALNSLYTLPGNASSIRSSLPSLPVVYSSSSPSSAGTHALQTHPHVLPIPRPYMWRSHQDGQYPRH